MPKPLILMTPPWFLMVFRYLTRTVPDRKIFRNCFKIDNKSMNILLKLPLTKTVYFYIDSGMPNGPRNRRKRRSHQKWEFAGEAPKTQEFTVFSRTYIKITRKTRVFDVPGPPRPLQTSKEPSGPQFDRKMVPPGP